MQRFATVPSSFVAARAPTAVPGDSVPDPQPEVLLRRALVGAVAVLVLVLAILLLLPVLFKDRLLAIVTDAARGQVDADVALGDADVSLIRSFPDLHLAVADLVVTGRGPWAGVELARIGELALTVDLASVVRGGAVRVTGLSLADTRVHVIVDEQGRSNADVAGGSEGAADADAEPAEPAADDDAGSAELWLRDVDVSGVDLVYEDRAAGRVVTVEDFGLRGDADVSGETVALRTDLSMASLDVRDGGVPLLAKAKVGADLDVRYAPATGRVDLGKSTLRLNDLAVDLEGSVVPQGDDTALDLAFQAQPTTFKSLLSLIPGAYTADFAGVEAAGSLALKGAVKGVLPAEGDDLPGFDVAVQVADGRFRYPGVPVGVTDIALDLAVRHPGGSPDLVAVDLPRFHLAVDGSPLDGRLSLRTPVSDPAVDTRVKGRVDLARLAAAVPGSTWTGTLDVDLDLAGKVSAFQALDTDHVRAAGTFALADVVWTDPGQPVPITVESLKVAIDPRKVDLADMRLRFGASDLAATGQVENVLGYLLADQALAGRLDVRSKMLDLNPWAGGEDDAGGEAGGGGAPTPGAEADDSSLFAVPTNLDLALAVKLDRVLYADWDLRDVRGEARTKDGVVTLDDLRAKTLGGEIAISGRYAAPTDERADVDMKIEAIDLAAGETVERVETIARVLPAARGATGRLRTGFGFSARLGKDLRPDLATLVGAGRVGAADLRLQPSFLAPVAAFVGDDRFATLVLDQGDVAFDIEGGRLRLDRVPFSVAGAKGELAGSTGILDEALDLTLKVAVPASAVKGAGAAGGAAAAALGKGGTVDVVAGIGGTWKDPKVKVGLGDSAKDALVGAVEEKLGDVRAAAAEKAAAVVDELVAKAKAQGDRLVAEAEVQGEKLVAEAKKAAAAIRSEADKQAKKLASEAKGNPLKEAAAKEAGKKLREEADDKADKLEAEAAKKAAAAVAAARKERDRLVAEAETGAKKAKATAR